MILYRVYSEVASWGTPGSGDGQFGNAVDIAVLEQRGTLLVLDSTELEVQEFTFGGAHVRTVDLESHTGQVLSDPRSISASSNEVVAVVDPVLSKVVLFPWIQSAVAAPAAALPTSLELRAKLAAQGAGVEVSLAATVSDRDARVRVFDARGRMVKTLQLAMNHGVGSTEWNLTDERGMRVASGVYFLDARLGSHRASGKVAVFR